MNRCFTLIEKFKKMPEFVEYRKNASGYQGARFEKGNYVVELLENLYEEPLVYERKEKVLKRLKNNELPEQIQDFYDQISFIMNEVNRHYAHVLPNQKKQRGVYGIEIENIAEFYEKEKKEPNEINFWHRIERYDDIIAEYFSTYQKKENEWKKIFVDKRFMNEYIEDEKLAQIMDEEYELIEKELKREL